MKNRSKIFIVLLLIIFFNISPIYSIDKFNFDATEVEIVENGNKFIGNKRVLITTDNNIKIEANKFTLDKLTDILVLNGNVVIEDISKNLRIFSDQVTYRKNEEIFTSESNSKIINWEDGIEVNANKFFYNKLTNILKLNGDAIIEDKNKKIKIFSEEAVYYRDKEIFISESKSKFVSAEFEIVSDKMKYNKNLDALNSNGDVKITDFENNYIIFAEDISYLRDIGEIFTVGKTKALIYNKYDFDTADIHLLRNENILASKKKTKILEDKHRLYELDSFRYDITKELLKANNFKITSDNTLADGESDNLIFKDGFFNLKDRTFIAKETTINLKKNSFDNRNNDPRLKGVSSSSENQITVVNKGVFTSCKKRDGKCPPWSITAKKITHDKNKKKLIYDHAFLNVYDKPIIYFPKFFHPDPTVERQTGFLKPQLNNSEILGSSLYLPYFYVISESKDFTFKPTFFENDIYMLQNEYRSEKENSSFTTDFSLTTGYKSSLSSSKNSISHLFAKYDLDLNLNNFETSKLNFFLEKVSNDTYLKVFDTNLIDTEIRPMNPNILKNGIKLTLDHENYNFDMGINAFENLQKQSSDRFQYILPYYNFSNSVDFDKIGSLEFSSSGSNNLIETNNLESNIINNINFKIIDQIAYEKGLKNNLGLYFKNLNTVAKNNNKYKSSPQVELMSIIEANTSMPLKKISKISEHFIEPKISLRFNPGDMKNYKSTKRIVNADNVFDINRLGLSDSFEAGKSLTAGINYKITSLSDINNYFETKISTVLRDKKENFVPESSTLNNKNSNLFGSVTYNHSKNFQFDYDFSINNNLDRFDSNSISSEFSYKNFSTTIKFIEENDVIGNTNSMENNLEYRWKENSYLKFNTRRNRTLNLTEYYDLLYEYKNDCLTAGFKYKKTYYQDRDLKPKEDLLLTVSFYPLTTYEQEIDQNLYRD